MTKLRILFLHLFVACSIFSTQKYPFTKPKVFDCFPFLHEFEMLNVRMHELNDIVDYFVLVESIETQRGNVKPLYFEENKHLFKPYLHKIIHVALRDRQPQKIGWGREHFQRNSIMKGLKGKCRKHDIVLISDVDEIPTCKALLEAKELLRKGSYAVRFQQEMFYYKLNMQTPSGKTHGGIDWIGTVATTYQALKKKTNPQSFRDQRETSRWPLLQKGGWHFSSAGPNDFIRQKLFSVIEGSDNVPTDDALQHIFDSMKVVSIDASFPKYIHLHYTALQDKGYLIKTGNDAVQSM